MCLYTYYKTIPSYCIVYITFMAAATTGAKAKLSSSLWIRMVGSNAASTGEQHSTLFYTETLG